jgi:hypothetical protein
MILDNSRIQHATKEQAYLQKMLGYSLCSCRSILWRSLIVFVYASNSKVRSIYNKYSLEIVIDIS